MRTPKITNLMVLGLGMLASAANASANEAYSALDADLTAMAEIFQSGTEDDHGRDCKLAVLHASEGPGNESISISIEASNGTEVSVFVSKRDAIAVAAEGDDADYKRIYRVKGVATVGIASSEDNYDEVSVSDGRTTLTCGVYR